MSGLRCRACGSPALRSILDLGVSPLANAFVAPAAAESPETFYPLHVRLCDECRLVQLPSVASREEIFGEYVYFSSYSSSWLDHARRYTAYAQSRFALGPESLVLEIASNDGYLLRWFRELAVPVVGVEPAANVARTAIAAGIPTRIAFFGLDEARRIAAEGLRPDLIVSNNVLAHVPDLNDFLAGAALLLADGGRWTIEFPHLLRLLAETQFDTIYHEHYCYFSLLALGRALARHGLVVFDVEELSTHGGSLRLYVGAEAHAPAPAPAVEAVRQAERAAGLDDPSGYAALPTNVRRVRDDILRFLIDAARDGKRVAGFGAPAKGNTLLNYAGIKPDLLPFTVDSNPAKQNLLLPGTRIPVFAPARLYAEKPDFVWILPWNLRDEIAAAHERIREWGGRFVVAVPRLTVF